MVRQPAARCFFLPLFRIAVAVEDDAFVIGKKLANIADRFLLELSALKTFTSIREILEALCDRRVQDHVAIRKIHGRTRHAELELVARECKGARAIAVGVVFEELRQNRNAQIHRNGLS